MGGRTTGKKNLHSKKKGYKRSHATKSRARDIDQIQVHVALVFFFACTRRATAALCLQ